VTQPRVVRRKVLAFALSLPGTYEDHPWEEDVAKVAKKIFVFLGVESGAERYGMTVKLRDSLEQALTIPGAEPTGYGLGRAGWVTIPFKDTTPPVDVLTDWVEESYRIVAPKRLVAELDARMASPASSTKPPRIRQERR
jgi:predicted DNA-binding protein (MmcQ/YjbR family)